MCRTVCRSLGGPGMASSLGRNAPSDGTVWAFGDSANGGLGDGTATRLAVQVLVSGLTHVTAAAAEWGYSVALMTYGTAPEFKDQAASRYVAAVETRFMNTLTT